MTKEKILTLTAAILITAALSGCAAPAESGNKNAETTVSTSKNETPDENQSETSEEAEEKGPTGFGETITFNEWEITVNSAETAERIENSAYTSFTPDEGNVYIVINITAKNIDKNSATFLPSFTMGKDIKAKLVHGDYEFNATNLMGYSEELHNTTLNPLSSKTGVIAFSVANDIADLSALNLVIFNNDEEYTFSLADEDVSA